VNVSHRLVGRLNGGPQSPVYNFTMADAPQRPDRVGKKTVVIYLPADIAKQFKVLAVQTDRTMQEIGEEALLEWLKKNGKTATKGK
jgi:hypothetical protein